MTKLFVVAHKDVFLPNSSILFLINPDKNDGDNISHMENYSELRAHYWVWKNEPDETDTVGFFQFRRYLDFLSTDTKKPYTIRKFPKAADYTYSQNTAEGLDVIAPLPEYTGKTVWDRYGLYHRVDDLRLVYDIIGKKYPEHLTPADLYLNGKFEYYGNLYIMRREVFNDYYSWLFSILTEFDSLSKSIAPRTQGYIAERLFGVWFTKQKEDGIRTWKEVPRVHFWGYDDENHNLRCDKLVNFFLPPGSKRRIWVKGRVER